MLSSHYARLPLVGWYIEGEALKENRTNNEIGWFEPIKDGWKVVAISDRKSFTGQTKEAAMQLLRDCREVDRVQEGGIHGLKCVTPNCRQFLALNQPGTANKYCMDCCKKVI